MKRSLLVALFMAETSGIGSATIVTGDSLNFGWGNTVVEGGNSFALGVENTASTQSIAVGAGSSAINMSFSIGLTCYAYNYSIASGRDNIQSADSEYAFMTGFENTMQNASRFSALVGWQNQMKSQDSSLIVGGQNKMNFPSTKDGSANVILGEYNTIDATASSAPSLIRSSALIGYQNTTSESMAYAIGVGNIAQANSVTMGSFAQPTSSAVLIIGNGTGTSNRSNALVVNRDGGINIPSGNLILNGQSALTPASAQSVISSHLTSNNYLKRAYGTGALIVNGGLLAIGDGATTESSGGIAIGNGTFSLLNNGIAIGGNALSYGEGGLALGYNSEADGFKSTAITNSAAAADYSFAANDSQAYGWCSAALSGAFAWGTGAVAIGGAIPFGITNQTPAFGNEASGDYSVALGGLGNYSVGIGSYAMGTNSTAIGNHSNSVGYLTASKAAFETVFGSNNLSAGDIIGDPDATTWQEDDLLFELGNGNPTLEASAEYSNAITTLKNGQTILTNKAWKQDPNVTPTTSNAGGKALVVEGHTEIQGNAVINGKTVLNGAVVIAQPQGDIAMGIYGN